jgi:hypothetical protein
MNRTEIGQGTLASTNRLLLRGFSCELFGFLDQIALYANPYHTRQLAMLMLRERTNLATTFHVVILTDI